MEQAEKNFRKRKCNCSSLPVISELTEQAESEHEPWHRLDEEVGQASGPPGGACESSSNRAGSALHTGSARVQTLRQRDSGDRLRGKFPVRCGASEVFRASQRNERSGLAGRTRNQEWFQPRCREGSSKSVWRGSPQAGPKVAAILSVVESCRRLQVPVRDYLSTVLPGFADLPIRCLPDLTPAVWVTRHS
jgi:hypothetical protein